MKNLNKLVALLLAAVMVLGMMPAATVHAHVHTHGVEDHPALALDTVTDVTIAAGGDIAYFTFTPEVTDLYHFYSAALPGEYTDTYATLYDAEMTWLADSDDAVWGNPVGVFAPNFCISYVMESGKTYVLAARLYSTSRTGAFTVTLTQGHEYEGAVTTEMTCTADGVMTYTCIHCGDSYTEAIPAEHVYNEETGKCNFCGEEYLLTGTCGDNLTWSLDYFGNLKITGTGDMYNYLISWGDDKVPAPWYDYSYDAIKTITIDEGCTSIGNYAFYQCGSVTEIVLPESVTKLGSNAFGSCYALTEIVLPDAITTIPDSCFASCGALTTFNWPASLTTIETNAFYGCSIGDQKLPEGVTTIGQYAFAGCSNLTKLTLPTTLTTLDAYAFASMWSTKTFVFTGNAPAFGDYVFNYGNATAWYPAGNETWTADVCQQYGGTITWMGMCSGEHAYGDAVTVEATCETGAYMTMTCDTCGWVEISPEISEPLGHDLVETVIEPDCSNWQYGRTEVTCTRCDYYESKDWIPYEHKYEATVIEPTCATDGYTKYTCTVCGDYYTDNYIYAAGHSVENWSEPTEATCTEDGVKTGTCDNCGETVTEVVTAALGHEWDMDNGTVNDDGTTTYSCIRCDATYTTEGPFLFAGDNQFTIEASTGGRTKSYTATETGTLTLTLNNVYYYHEWSQAWNTLATDWAFSYPHFEAYVNGTKSSYTVQGSETAANIILTSIEVKKDDVVTLEIKHTADSFYNSNEVRFNVNVALVPAHTHSYTAVVTAPTCTTGGYTTYTCECGDSYTADETAALGHDYEAVVTDPTCDDYGFTAYTCSRCGDDYIDEDSWVEPGHKWDDGVVTAPTCTEDGYTTFTCTACGESYIDEDSYTDALGHAWKGTGCERCDATRENPFTDVPEDSFYIDPVLWAVEEGITTGATETTFNPTGDLQRAQVVVMLWRAAGEPEPTTNVNPFNDVKETDFFYKAVLWAVEEKITTGTSANEFSPYGITNRAQAVTFLWRYLDEPEATATNSFTDVEAGLWYEAPINWAVGAGVTNGINATEFGINANCNRAAMVTFLYRALA